ncbi:uncharacterized protein PAC_01092 [Phialocephala subalpina]|uniref:Uncharacterized protein n=1 Tax=Phialocephala subalpina TaxID=576137 RepID=A0A1L7WEK2_9HELO|nr:uncharacterized protein PAC_01092 [Phialocephala subalpina]
MKSIDMAVNTVDAAECSIFDATDACRGSFEDCLTITSLTNQEWAENRLADFNLWAAGVGASVKSRASLDERLAFEPEVRALVVNLLITLKAFIEQCKEIGLQKDGFSQAVTSTAAEADEHGSRVAGIDATSPEDPISRSFSPVSNASSSNSGSETISLSEPPLTEAIKSTEVILDQLTRLAVAIRRSGTASRLQKADRSFDPQDHEDLRSHLALILLARPADIEDRRHAYWDNSRRPDKSVNFGVDATQLNTVQQRLVDANIRRRNRFVYAQRHAIKLGASQVWSTPKRVENHHIDAVEGIPRRKEAVSNWKQNNAGIEGLKITQDTLATTDTTASAVGTTIVLNTSNAPTPSQQAMTQVSSTGLKLTYPNPPKVKEGLKSFKCPCCCQIFPSMFTERHLWRKHIAADLCPYTCPFDDCPEPQILYITREEWMTHFQTDHQSPKYWECFACDELGRILNVETFTTHIQNQHQEAISDSQIPTLIDICSRTALPIIVSCPLCDFANEHGFTVDQNSLLDHVAKHVHEFSLRSLPWAAAASEVHKPSFDHSLEKVRNWFTRWPTSEEGEECHPAVDAEYAIQGADSYFGQNGYFAEDSERSSLAQMHFHTSGDDSEEMLSLSSLSEGGFESTAAGNESIPESIPGKLESSAAENELSQYTSLDTIDPNWREIWGDDLQQRGITDDLIRDYQDLIADYFKHRQATENVSSALLLDTSKVDADWKDGYGGRTPLSWAAENGHEAIVKLLLDTSKVDADSKNVFGQTPLLLAAKNGHEAVVKLLLERGAELETRDNNGRTLLLWAVKNGHEAVVKLLLERGAELETRDAGYSQTPLSWAAKNGHEAVVKLLLERGAELETRDKYGQTPLSWAAKTGHEAVVKLLLERGAELETRDAGHGQTPLLWAAENGHEAVVKLLLERGAELETRDAGYSQTPLSWAAENGHEAVVRLLLERGAELETRDKYGRTPLSWAAEYEHKAVVKLLEKGAKKL